MMRFESMICALHSNQYAKLCTRLYTHVNPKKKWRQREIGRKKDKIANKCKHSSEEMNVFTWKTHFCCSQSQFSCVDLCVSADEKVRFSQMFVARMKRGLLVSSMRQIFVFHRSKQATYQRYYMYFSRNCLWIIRHNLLQRANSFKSSWKPFQCQNIFNESVVHWISLKHVICPTEYFSCSSFVAWEREKSVHIHNGKPNCNQSTEWFARNLKLKQ